MIKEILYTTAVDIDGNIVRINEATKGRTYYCPNPNCNSELRVRKSGNTGKWSKRPHYYHRSLTTDCTPEGVLHLTFKKLLISFLDRHISESKPLNIIWKCNDCFIGFAKPSFKANLLAKTVSVKEEYDLKFCQPDIALLDVDGRVIVVIEIVVTHKPEEIVLHHYERDGIVLIQINLSSDEDLEKIEEKITCPDVVTFCLNSECSNFKKYTSERKLVFTDAKCKRCNQPMRTCQVQVDSAFGTFIPPMTEDEIGKAQSKGVRFKIMEDKTTEKKQTVISCLNCDNMDERMRIYYKRMRSRYRKPRL